MNNILSDVEHVFPAPCIFLSILCAGLCIPGPSSYKSLWYIQIEGLEFRVQCMICFILMQNAILLCVN